MGIDIVFEKLFELAFEDVLFMRLGGLIANNVVS
jgi:hypothetical protein